MADVPDAPDQELAELLEAVQQRCRASFTRLYVLTSARLFARILRINGVRSEAEELLQETYIAVWNRCAQYQPHKGKAIHWMLGMAHNLALSSLRARAARPVRQVNEVSESWSEAQANDPYARFANDDVQPLDRLIRAQADAAVRDTLFRMRAEHRQCFFLAYYDGLSHGQIAQQLGRPIGTVKGWLRRVPTLMRSTLNKHA